MDKLIPGVNGLHEFRQLNPPSKFYPVDGIHCNRRYTTMGRVVDELYEGLEKLYTIISQQYDQIHDISETLKSLEARHCELVQIVDGIPDVVYDVVEEVMDGL